MIQETVTQVLDTGIMTQSGLKYPLGNRIFLAGDVVWTHENRVFGHDPVKNSVISIVDSKVGGLFALHCYYDTSTNVTSWRCYSFLKSGKNFTEYKNITLPISVNYYEIKAHIYNDTQDYLIYSNSSNNYGTTIYNCLSKKSTLITYPDGESTGNFISGAAVDGGYKVITVHNGITYVHYNDAVEYDGTQLLTSTDSNKLTALVGDSFDADLATAYVAVGNTAVPTTTIADDGFDLVTIIDSSQTGTPSYTLKYYWANIVDGIDSVMSLQDPNSGMGIVNGVVAANTIIYHYKDMYFYITLTDLEYADILYMDPSTYASRMVFEPVGDFIGTPYMSSEQGIVNADGSWSFIATISTTLHKNMALYTESGTLISDLSTTVDDYTNYAMQSYSVSGNYLLEVNSSGQSKVLVTNVNSGYTRSALNSSVNNCYIPLPNNKYIYVQWFTQVSATVIPTNTSDIQTLLQFGYYIDTSGNFKNDSGTIFSTVSGIQAVCLDDDDIVICRTANKYLIISKPDTLVIEIGVDNYSFNILSIGGELTTDQLNSQLHMLGNTD